MRKAAIAVCCAFFMIAAAPASAPAAGPAPGHTGPLRVLVLGDSLSAGYGLAHPDGFQARLADALAAQGHDVALIDAAVSGDTTAGGRARLEWALEGAGGADAAIVELGGNDGLRGLDPAAMEANLTAILDTLAALHMPVLLTGMVAPPNMGAAYGKAFAAVFERLSHRPGLIYDPFFLDGVILDPALMQDDHIHANPAGVRKIVARILPLVDALLAKALQTKASAG